MKEEPKKPYCVQVYHNDLTDATLNSILREWLREKMISTVVWDNELGKGAQVFFTNGHVLPVPRDKIKFKLEPKETYVRKVLRRMRQLWR